jgi:hypothetical protein
MPSSIPEGSQPKYRFFRVTEVGATSPTNLDRIRANFEQLWGGKPSQERCDLNLVVFGAVDFLSIQEVPDLKALAVPPMRKVSRFQRTVGAWSSKSPPSWSLERPYVAVCHVKLNPTADLLVGDRLTERVAHWVNNKDHGLALHGIDSSRFIIIQTAKQLTTLEEFAWELRELDLNKLDLDVNIEPATTMTVFGTVPKPAQLAKIRALSWSHSIVGLSTDLIIADEVRQEILDERQDVSLRTRYRLIPGHDLRPSDDKPGSHGIPANAHSVFGNYDMVADSSQPVTNGTIRDAMKIVWRDWGHFVVETEVQFNKPSSCARTQDVLTNTYLSREPDLGLVWKGGEKLTIENFPQRLREQKWSYQRVNGAVSLLLAYAHRVADPFDIGQVWQLRKAFQYWIEMIPKHRPDDSHLKRWMNYLERAIRLDDERVDPSERPALSLSLVSRGGVLAMREAFATYIDEFVANRSGVRNITLVSPLIVDDSGPRLRVRRTFDSFVLSISSFYVQAMQLWPSIVHEIEHIALSIARESDMTRVKGAKSRSHEDADGKQQESLLPPGHLLEEAVCDLAIIDSGALGDPDELGVDICLERVAAVLFGSLAPSIFESDGEHFRREVDRFLQRLVYLWILARDEKNFTREHVHEALDSEWWVRWARQIHGPDPNVSLDAQRERVIDNYDHDLSIHVFKCALPERKRSPVGECGRALHELMTTFPKQWELGRGELNLRLDADLVCPTMVKMRVPTWKARQEYLSAVRGVS